MDKILVSIIIPINQLHDYFKRCLDSMFNQTLQNLEIIVVDDHSKDDIKSAIGNYLDDSRCRYIRTEASSGPGGARNEGIDIARGEYIGFCDSDDWVDYDYYEKVCNLLTLTQADIAMCGIIRESDTLHKQPIYMCKYNRLIEMSGEQAFQIMSAHCESNETVSAFCTNKVYRRAFLKNSSLRFQKKVYFQDVIFFVETMFNANKVICVPTVLYHHYRRKNSIIQSFDEKHIGDFENLVISIKKYLIYNKIYEKHKRSYYSLMAYYYKIVICEIFEFIASDEERKQAIFKTFPVLQSVFDIDEYINLLNAEQLRDHLFPHMDNTTLY